MAKVVEKERLTQKQRLFVNEYCRTGNAYQSYIKVFTVEKDSKRNNVEKKVSLMVRKNPVKNYIEQRQRDIEKSSKADALFVVNSLLEVVDNNKGKSCSIKAIELIGKLQGMFWEIPARKLDENVGVDNNIESIKKIVQMTESGKISEGCANNWIQMLEQKSRIEEREQVNKEIISRLDRFEGMMKERSADMDAR